MGRPLSRASVGGWPKLSAPCGGIDPCPIRRPSGASGRSARPAGTLRLDAGQRQVIEHDRGVLRVLAGPGTGKTRTLIEAAATRVERGLPANNLLLLTFSRRAAGQLRDQLTARLQQTIAEPVARTFHSYAFGLVRRAAVLRGDPPPRLLSGSEQDVTLRELLAGRLADGSDVWPAELAAAARTQAFSDELRELLMRAVERDITPRQLAALGRTPWTAGLDRCRSRIRGVSAGHRAAGARRIRRGRAHPTRDHRAERESGRCCRANANCAGGSSLTSTRTPIRPSCSYSS